MLHSLHGKMILLFKRKLKEMNVVSAVQEIRCLCFKAEMVLGDYKWRLSDRWFQILYFF